MSYCKDCGTELEMLSIEGKFMPYCTSCKAWVLPEGKSHNLSTSTNVKHSTPFPIMFYISKYIDMIIKHPAFWTFWIGFIAGELLK